MGPLAHLIANNRRWARELAQAQPGFFQRLLEQQAPRYLWIGCADSRVPANEIVGLLPGELFVHRNVGNLVVHTDLNCLSVLQYAVDVLNVEHVIVCGHYGCGGIRAADQAVPLGLIDNWLRHIQDVAAAYRPRLACAASDSERCDRLAEFNVLEQALNVCRTTTVQAAWRAGKSLEVHAWIYRLSDGLVQDLGFCASGSAAPADELAAAVGRLDARAEPARVAAPLAGEEATLDGEPAPSTADEAGLREAEQALREADALLAALEEQARAQLVLSNGEHKPLRYVSTDAGLESVGQRPLIGGRPGGSEDR